MFECSILERRVGVRELYSLKVMDLLPKNNTEYATKEYWQQRYDK